jgi:hypothetical protein
MKDVELYAKVRYAVRIKGFNLPGFGRSRVPAGFEWRSPLSQPFWRMSSIRSRTHAAAPGTPATGLGSQSRCRS